MAKADLRVGSYVAAPGQKTAGMQEMVINGQHISTPLFLINGREPGPTLAVTAGVHGAEYASIEAALQLGRSLEPAGLGGQVVVLPIANIPAFRSRSIYVCPLDGKNLNRFFPGKEDGTATEQIAAWVFANIIRPADYYIDMHGGDLIEALQRFSGYAVTGNARVDQAALEMAKVYGLPYVNGSEVHGAAYGAAAHAGVPALLTESGAQGIWTSEDVGAHTRGLNRVMRHLGMMQGPPLEPLPVILLKEFASVSCQHEGYYYPVVQPGQDVQQGQLLGRVTDFMGQTLQSAAAPFDGRVLFVVSSLAINKGDPLVALGR